MLILAIETSCDDTCISFLDFKSQKRAKGPRLELLSNIVSSQVEIHKEYGGIVPNLASREHLKNLRPVFEKARKESGFASKRVFEHLDLIAVTRGPGLIPSLLVGGSFAKSLAWRFDIDLVGINHLKGHLYSNFISSLQKGELPSLPALCLIVSGGHTQLVLFSDHGDYRVLGETQDDAAGEAFDKVARLLDLGFPGGPEIEKKARNGNSEKFQLPRPMYNSQDFNFSFSGLKTAVVRRIEKQKLNQELVSDMAASFQEAVVDVLTKKLKRASEEFSVKSIFVSGGVSANGVLRERLQSEFSLQNKPELFLPSLPMSTDNAAMIGVASFFKKQTRGDTLDFSPHHLEVDPNLTLKSEGSKQASG
jgi:N6-L-threonylcarbamoyladenine synthase